jgi:hypothetical protein
VDSVRAYFAMPAFPRGPWRRHDTLELTAVSSAVPRARRRTREMLWEWKLDFLADDAELVVSELAGNAIAATRAAADPAGAPSHASGDGGGPGPGIVWLRMLGGPSRLLILMRDGVLAPPVLSDHVCADGEGGRGLLLVDALAARWHWYHPPRPHGGKVVWALLDRKDPDMTRCACGYQAADAEELGDHLMEMFTPADDRDASGTVHAEVSRDRADFTSPYRCVCGHLETQTAGLDRHLLEVFSPADRIGLDGRVRAPADPG